MQAARDILERMRAELRLADSWGTWQEEEEEEEGGEGEEEEEAMAASPEWPEPGLVSPRGLGATSPGIRLPTLDRSQRGLLEVPEELWQRGWLTRVLLSCNPRLEALDGSALGASCPGLVELDLAHCAGLKQLQLSSCLALATLRLSGCLGLAELSLPPALTFLELDYV